MSLSIFESRSLAPGFTLHVNSTQKPKTNRMAFFWVADLSADVTERALLPSILSRGCRSFPTLREVSRHLEHLFGATLTPDVMKLGERHAIVFRFDFANDRFLPAGETILEEAIAFVREIIVQPFLEAGVFPREVVEQEKENHRRLVEGLFNDKGSYALQRSIGEMCGEEEFRRYEYGSVDDLKQVTPEALTAQWRTSLESAETHVYFAGDVDPSATATALASLAEGRRGAPRGLKPLAPHRHPGTVREVVERLDVQQAKLVLGYRTGTRLGDPQLEAMAVANGILGLFPHSKLFTNVREKASLCYYANSHFERTHGLIFITSGIDDAKKEQALALIQKQVDDLRSGNIGDDELIATLNAFDNQLMMLEDNPGVCMDVDLTWRLAGVDYEHQAYRERLARVTKEQVTDAARRLELDTVYLLCPQETS